MSGSFTTKVRVRTIAQEAIKIYGSCSSGHIFDYIKSENPKNQRWLPLRGSINGILASDPDKGFYRNSKGEWCHRTP